MLCLLICIMFMFQGRVFYVMSVNLYNVRFRVVWPMLCLLICIMFMFQGRVAYVMSVNLYNVHVSGSCGLCYVC